MKRLPLSAPYSTRAMDAAWRKRVSEEHEECKKRNPQLMRRLAKLTDAQLTCLMIAVLELESPSPSRNEELRMLRDTERLRSAPKPVKRPGNVPRLRDSQPEHRAPLHEQPPGLAEVGSPDLTAPTNTVPPAPPAPPAPAQPSNVIFAGKFFHSGRTSPRWIGGEV
jgi:hypothetical protein